MWQFHYGDPAWPALAAWADKQPRPAAIVVVSGHWAEEIVSVTTDEVLPNLAEGFPSPLDELQHKPKGSPELSSTIIALLEKVGIAAKGIKGRGLDHGAIIPLLAMDPKASIPVVQLSLQEDLDPQFHLHLGAALRSLPSDVMVLGSGGLVHNRHRIIPVSGRTHIPEKWAADFDKTARQIVVNSTGKERNEKLINLSKEKSFVMAHPTPEHFTPLLVCAGVGGAANEISGGFQWQNLSMAGFAFENSVTA